MNTRVTPDFILAQIRQLNVCYPVSRLSELEMKSLSVLWFEDLSGHTCDDLKEAVVSHRRTSNFFPTVKEIRDATNKIAERKRQILPQLPEPQNTMTVEEMRAIRERNMVKIKKMTGRIGQ